MARESFHGIRVRDALLCYLAKTRPHGHGATNVLHFLQVEQVRCDRAGVNKSLTNLVNAGWLISPKFSADLDAGKDIDDLLEVIERDAPRTNIPCLGYRLTKNGMIAAHVALARHAFERRDHQAFSAWLTQIQRDVSRTSAKLPSLKRDHVIAVSKHDAARLNAIMANPPSLNATTRAAAKLFRRDLASGAILITETHAAAAPPARGPRARPAAGRTAGRSGRRIGSARGARTSPRSSRRRTGRS